MKEERVKQALRERPVQPEVRMRYCENLFFAVGEETKCGNLAQYVFDEGEEGEMYVCEKCAKNIHISRLTGIAF